jgi:SET and MYND domain-containing protein
MLSHECVPNAVFATRSKKILLFAIKPIAKDEEITISYIEDYYPTRLRQNALRTNRGFACCCQYCIERPDRARAFRCPDCNNGVVLPVGEGKIDALWKCQYCGYEAPGELKRQMESDEEVRLRL